MIIKEVKVEPRRLEFQANCLENNILTAEI